MALPAAVTVKVVVEGKEDCSMFSENWSLIYTPPSKTVALVSVGGLLVLETIVPLIVTRYDLPLEASPHTSMGLLK